MINNTNDPHKLKTGVVIFVLLVCVTANGQSIRPEPATPHFDSTAVWHAPADFRKAFDMRCDTLRGTAFQDCFLNLMRDLGATPEALRFAELTDTTGYVRRFVNAGSVDIAYVCYPFRANENYGVTLVNGRPGMIDVDDFQYIDLTLLKKDTTYLNIVNDFPDAAVWPGDRYLFDQPTYTPLPGGGQRFIVEYMLKNGCHACANLAAVRFAFDFDSTGDFIGTRLISVTRMAR